MLIGEGPGSHEELYLEPFVGPSGWQLDAALKNANIDRVRDCHVTNALECRPAPGTKLKPAEWKQALDCCRPRLEAELGAIDYDCIVALGARALQATVGHATVQGWWGSPLSSPYGPVMPVMHPAFCLRKSSFLPVFRHFIARTANLVQGRQTFKRIETDSLLIEAPGPAMLKMLSRLAMTDDPITVDIETSMEDMFDLHLIGIGNSAGACAVPYPFPPGEYEHYVRFILQNKRLVMQNGAFDVRVLRKLGFDVADCWFDTMVAHYAAASQLPHDLGFIASIYLLNERWKTEHKRHIGTDEIYNCKDVVATARLVGPLQKELDHTYKGNSLFYEGMAIKRVQMRMTERGVMTDPAAFEEHRRTLDAKKFDACMEFTQLTDGRYSLGKNGLHTGLKKLYFKELGMQPLRYSPETGEPSLDALTLETYIADGHPLVKKISRAILDYRRAGKLKSTYVDGLPISDEGVVHASWKLGPVTGRWACSQPNLMNQPSVMRNMYVPRDGMHLVKADFSQLEYMIVAFKLGVKKWMEAFQRGEDIHMVVAEMLSGDEWAGMDQKQRDKARKTGKGGSYAKMYGALPETAWRQAVVRNPAARLPMYVEMWEKFDEEYPELATGQRELLEQAEKDGFVREPLSGRTEWFHNGIEQEKVLNFPIQAGAGTIMNRAVLALDKEIRWDQGESILFQVHDELVVEGPDKNRLVELLRNAMEQTVDFGFGDHTFPIDVETGPNYRDTKEITRE